MKFQVNILVVSVNEKNTCILLYNKEKMKKEKKHTFCDISISVWIKENAGLQQQFL